ncbi:DUF4145 domain-containing protein [bacterium]|nr:DUF4145 domain-containing protein [bacterium]
MNVDFTPPTWNEQAFHCPFCGVYAFQRWQHYQKDTFGAWQGGLGDSRRKYSTASCLKCNEISIWVRNEMVYPISNSAPPPNSDLPEDIQSLYNEASLILQFSPRGAAALLRLAIESMCIFLGEKGKLHDMIASLVKNRGLLPHIQKSLDAVRVIGNEFVHPGKIAVEDDYDTALSLFYLVNQIALQLITMPKQAEEIYLSLPESKREHINLRDG